MIWALFSIFVAFCLAIIIKTLQNGISPMPSSKAATQAIISFIPKDYDGTIIDLGSGFGTLALALSKAFPKAQVIGYENSFVPYLVSKIFSQKNLHFYHQDFLTIKLPPSTIFVTYLFPKGMEALAPHLQQTQTTLISNTFALPGHTPTQTHRLKDIYNTPIYLYHSAYTKRADEEVNLSNPN